MNKFNNLKKHNRACDFCGGKIFFNLMNSKDHYNSLPGIFSVVRCEKCKLIYTNPILSNKDLLLYYPDSSGYYLHKKSPSNSLKILIEKQLLINYYNYPGIKNIILKIIFLPLYLIFRRKFLIEAIPHYLSNNSTLLDIGCSTGDFIDKLKKLGWKVAGLEMNNKSAEYAKNELGLDVINSKIEDLGVSKKYQVITMRMVLEHVYSPKKILDKVYKLLEKNGKLIIVVPDYSGFERKLYKNYAYTLHLPCHYTHFTAESIKKYLKKSGFKNIKIYHHFFDRDLVAPLKYMQDDGLKVNFIKSIFENKIFRHLVIKSFVFFMSLLGKTSRMTIYAEK